MKNNLKITVVVENSTRKKELLAEHGLSLFIEHNGKNILFDTGQGMAFFHNAKKLGINLKELDAIILSHGHYDHTGALKKICEENPHVPIYTHPKSFIKRYSLHADNSLHSIGMKEVLNDNLALHLNENPCEIFESFFLTGEVPLQNNFEDSGGNFFIDKQCQQRDLIPDDQAVFIETSKGIVVILGCSHSGIINTLNHIKKLSTLNKFYAIIGGMHLINANDYRIKNTINELNKLDIKTLYPAHCTGFNATLTLYNDFKNTCQIASTGDVIEIL